MEAKAQEEKGQEKWSAMDYVTEDNVGWSMKLIVLILQWY